MNKEPCPYNGQIHINGGQYSVCWPDTRIRGRVWLTTALFGCMLTLLSVASWAAQTCNASGIVASTPTTQFTVNGDGTTVSDQKTALMWQRCLQGLSGSDCATGTATTYSWDAALAQASTANTETLSGHNDWRLPNLNELLSLVEVQCADPAINIGVFPNSSSVSVWSGSPVTNSASHAWNVNFYYGNASINSRVGTYQVRLVRSVPSAP